MLSMGLNFVLEYGDSNDLKYDLSEFGIEVIPIFKEMKK